MRSFVTAVIAAIEAAAVAVAGLLGVAIPVLLLWIITFDLSAEPARVAAWTAGVWLLAHLVPLGFEVPAEAALALGLPPEAIAVPLSLAPLGVTLATAALAVRAGWRFGRRGGAGAAGALGGGAGFAVVAFLAVQVAGDLVAWPAWLAVLVPGAIYGLGSLAGFLVRAARDGHDWWEAVVRRTLKGLDGAGVPGAAALRSRAATTLRLASAACAGLLGLAAVAVAIALVVGYARVIELSQSLQLDWLGSILVFVAQLALIPVAIVWAAAWITGAGFAIGSGTSVTPFETLMGPLPALPLFGAIPQGWGALGALPPALLVLAAVALGAALARRSELRRASWPVALAVPVAAAALAGLAVAGLTTLATGAIGPHRLAVTGADPWIVGGLAAAELGAGLLIGVSAARIDAARLREAVPAEVPGGDALRRLRERVGDRAADLAARRPTRGAAARTGEPGPDDQPTLPIDDAVLPDRARPAGGDPADAQETADLGLGRGARGADGAAVVPFPVRPGAADEDAASDADVEWGADRESDPESTGDPYAGSAPEEGSADPYGADPYAADPYASDPDATHELEPLPARPARESFYDQDPELDPADPYAEVAEAAAEPRDEIDEEALLRAYAWDGGASFGGAGGAGGADAAGTRAPGAAEGAADGRAADDAEAGERPARDTGRRRGWRGLRRGR